MAHHTMLPCSAYLKPGMSDLLPADNETLVGGNVPILANIYLVIFMWLLIFYIYLL